MTIVRTRRTTDNAGADAVIAAAERHANENGYRVVIAVVDPSGELIAMHRTEGAQVASSRVAVDKARTAAIFIRPSREMEEQVTGGRLGALALHGASCLTGGIPLKVDGELVGAVGTSGETPRADHHRPGEALEGHQMVRRWVGAGMLEAERTFRRIKGCKDMPTLVAAVRTEVARRVAADAGEPVTAPQYDQAAARTEVKPSPKSHNDRDILRKDLPPIHRQTQCHRTRRTSHPRPRRLLKRPGFRGGCGHVPFP